jgi:hypothetical protein
MVLVRSWKTTTMVVKNGRLTGRNAEAVRAFSRARAFDVAWLPGIREDEINRYNRLEQPFFHAGMQALLGADAQAFVDRYRFDLRPATDDRPYFGHYTRWDALPALVALPAHGGLAQLDWGYWIQVATLSQAAVLGLLLILAPLPLGYRLRMPAGVTTRSLGYFALVGLAFMFVELAFIQKLQLFLGHPVYAVALVLSGFLLFAGAGSGLSRQVLARLPGGRPLVWWWIALTACVVAELWLLSAAASWVLSQPLVVRAGCCLLLILPLAFLMGMPFPWGLRTLEGLDQSLVPWAWGTNGYASVVSAVAAVLLAMEVGFSGVMYLGLLLYLLAVGLLPARGAATGRAASGASGQSA